MKTIRLIGIILIVSLVAWGFLAHKASKPAEEYSVPAGAAVGNLTSLQDCEFKPDKKKVYDAECGTLSVPENWDDEDSRLIPLPVVRISATRKSPLEPVFVLLGGPGTSNFLISPTDWLIENHDVVLVGYRGVDGSTDLNCPEVSEISANYVGTGFLSQEANKKLVNAALRCAQDLKAQGIDLNGYNAAGVVMDMEAAREALEYEKINLWSESYGTRVAQIYAYMYPENLHRVLMIGLNPPGHFLYDPADFDELIEYMSLLCTEDIECQTQTQNMAQAIYDVNHNMPDRWLCFPIDSGTIRLITQTMFYDTSQMPMIIDAYLAAANGDPSGLALLNFIAPFAVPFEMFHLGDLLNKGGSLDQGYYRGLETIALGDSTMGAPLAEWIWPMSAGWPVDLVDPNLRKIQESNVDMLIVNGSIDFSTPPQSIKEIESYYHHAQIVILSEFSHTGDVRNLQPEAFERLVTSYYTSGNADASLYEYQPLSFTPKVSMVTLAKIVLAVLVILPPLLIAVIVGVIRRKRKVGLEKYTDENEYIQLAIKLDRDL
jgi:pimeloyl-ACP methyl ester carboxylesterase